MLRPKASRRATPLATLTALALLAGALPLATVSAFTQNPATVWINEIHYDNAGTDAGEAIEVAGPAGTDLTGWIAGALQRQTGGATYDTTRCPPVSIPDQGGGIGSAVVDVPRERHPERVLRWDRPCRRRADGRPVPLLRGDAHRYQWTGRRADQHRHRRVRERDGALGSLAAADRHRLGYAVLHLGGGGHPTPSAGQHRPVVRGGGDAAPFVASSSPADGATGVAANVAVSVTFSESVSVDVGALVLSCDGPDRRSRATVRPRPSSSHIHRRSRVVPTAASRSSAEGVHDADAADPPDGLAANASIGFKVVSADPCAGTVTPIPAIQGSGPTAALTGPVTTQGVVVGDYEGPSADAPRLLPPGRRRRRRRGHLRRAVRVQRQRRRRRRRRRRARHRAPSPSSRTRPRSPRRPSTCAATGVQRGARRT